MTQYGPAHEHARGRWHHKVMPHALRNNRQHKKHHRIHLKKNVSDAKLTYGLEFSASENKCSTCLLENLDESLKNLAEPSAVSIFESGGAANEFQKKFQIDCAIANGQ